MWKFSFVIFALQLCEQLSAHSIYRDYNVDMSGPYEQQVPVNQHAAYTEEYGRALHDLAAYKEKLEQQGLFPNPPFIHTNNANDYAYQYLPTWSHYYPQQQSMPVVETKEPCAPTEEHKGDYHVPIPSVSVESSSEKHSVSESHTRKPEIGGHLNATIHKISDSIEHKVNSIKGYVEKSVHDINKLGDDMYQQVGGKTSQIFDAINKKLERIEHQLHELGDNTVRQIDEIVQSEETKEELLRKFVDDDDDDGEIQARTLDIPNEVESESGAQLKRLDDLEAEVRSDLKHSIADAIRSAHDRFNQLIEQQINKVNAKISKINEKVEMVVGRLAQLRHKPTVKEHYTTIHWEPKTPKPTTPAPKSATTPDYFKYTVPAHFFRSEDSDGEERSRMDIDVTTEKEETTTFENQYRSESSAVTTKAISEVEMQVIEQVKDAVKSSDLGEQSKSSAAESDVAKAAEQELQSEMKKVSAQTDAVKVDEKSHYGEYSENHDDDEEDEEHGEDDDEEEDSFKSAGDETTSTEKPKAPLIEEDDVVRPASQFDELEVIQLIPIIIEQLRQGHVTAAERSSLERIFGEALWSLMTAEAQRNLAGEAMNPLLRTLLESEEVRLAKRDIQSQIGNDIYKNSLRRVYRGKTPSHGVKRPRKSPPRPYISLDDDRKLLAPSERLLNMIAAIVHKSNAMEREKEKQQQRKSARSKKTPLGIAMPRQRYVDRILSTNRMKRSIIKFGTDLDDMRALLEQVNRENDSNEEDGKQQLATDEADDDYMSDDDYMDDDYDYSQQQPRQLAFDVEDDDDDDDAENDGFEANRWYYRRNLYDDYEDGSVNEFIHLARQRDRREKNSSPQLEDDDYEEEEEENDNE